MKPLIIYHKGCMDGAGAALAAWLKFGEDAEYRPAAYGDPAPTDEEVYGRDVYVLDFSYSREDTERIARVVCAPLGGGVDEREFRLLDHHKSAQKNLEGIRVPGACYITFDTAKSGAMLAWEFFANYNRCSVNEPCAPIPDLFAYIQDRDLWQWKLLRSKEISAALFASGATDDFRALISIYRSCDSSPLGAAATLGNLAREGAAILRTEAQMIARAVSTAEEVTLDGHRCLAVSCPLLQSEIGEALAVEGARRGLSPVGVVWHRNGQHGGAYRVSLRSRDIKRTTDHTDLVIAEAPDVSAIAKKLDPKGGGHHRAAGFECSRLPWDNTVAEVKEFLRGEWYAGVWAESAYVVEHAEARNQADLLLARIGATMEEIG